ncbi:DUF1667 domain-containing protein [Thermococcus gammatolerans]|uniref:Molybdopterin oxidoreductase n=1 Tax=Thermococcus gammatolerans (strain DSM 15229 / JCM 11827 / EJ3) TaxID=593117 RepID=C5A5L5_THEGJ|nr:DUF1667 domain-containing protein [Thermococcus gammatolerans]ACS33527.1 Conserved hypothetical protein [Thermococcus gammatolerans EJ3]
MSREYEVLCIRCPKGCRLRITVEGNEVHVSGFACLEGKRFGEEEVRNPRRIVTTTVRILNARYPRLPVRTAEPVPKDKIRDVIEALKGVVVKAPVRRGQVIVKDVAGTGVDVIAERDMEAVG